MKIDYSSEGVKTRLILSGLQEIESHGIKDFSLRRVALAANVSCAAPYRHFKDKDEFITEIIKYVGSRWDLMFSEIKKVYAGDLKSLIKNSSIAYIRFFLSNLNYRTILLSGLPATTYIGFDRQLEDLIDKYYNFAGFAKSKYFSVRSMIYGSILLSGLDDPEEIISGLSNVLDKEI